MNNNVIKDMERRLLEEDSHITIGDCSETTLIKVFKDQKDMPIENIIISLYNMCKINQYKISNLEDNLYLLANRVYKTDEDFTEEEKTEIKEVLKCLDLEELKDIDDNKGRLWDSLYCTEEDIDLMMEKQKKLINKICYPTPKMNETFIKMVEKEIEAKNEMEDK